MRFFGETTCIPLEVWQRGWMDVLPERIDHGVVGVAGGLGRAGLGAAILMRDMGAELVPEGDEPITVDQHLQLLDDMAALAARTWDMSNDEGLLPLGNHWLPFNEEMLAAEQARGWPDPVPRIAAEGWERFAARVPATVLDLVFGLRRDRGPLVDAIEATPHCFLHGDLKLGNVGFATDGRTILLDWTYCGPGPIAHDLTWHLAVNRVRLPHSKEDTVDAIEGALRAHGIDTSGWWERQVALCLLGGIVQFGWEKALGDDAELAWWCDHALDGARWL
jgi:hypothetical protein